MTDVDKLVALGMAPELAAAVVAIVAASVPTAAEINDAVSAKAEIAALTGASTAANIVTALQA
jgi:hypothetical protein